MMRIIPLSADVKIRLNAPCSMRLNALAECVIPYQEERLCLPDATQVRLELLTIMVMVI